MLLISVLCHQDFIYRRNLKAVCLVIDSRGGSLLESKMIFDYIKMKKGATKVGLGEARSNVPVYAFIANYATAGGYMVACAADRIFAHEFRTQCQIMSTIGFQNPLPEMQRMCL